MDFIGVLLLHLSYFGMGRLVLLGARGASACRPCNPEAVYLVGLLCQSLIIYSALAFGLAGSLPAILASAAGLSGFALALFLRVWRRESIPSLERPGSTGMLDRLSLLLLLPPVLLAALSLVFLPIYGFDSIAIWAVKARYLFQGESLISGVFQDPARVHPHPGYPLLLPIFLYQHFAAAGEVAETGARSGYLMLLICCLFHLFRLLRSLAGFRAAVLSIALLLYVPILSYLPDQGSPQTLYADFPLGLFMALMFCLTARFMTEGDPADLAMAAVLAGLAVLLKFEGVIWTVNLVFALGISRLLAVRFAWKNLLVFLLPLAVYCLTIWAHYGQPPSSDIRPPSSTDLWNLLSGAGRLVRFWLRSMIESSVWGVFPAATGLGLVLGWIFRFKNPLNLLSLAVIGQLLFYLIALGLLDSQLGLFDYYARSSYPRWIIQLLPAALAAAVCSTGTHWGRAPRSHGGRAVTQSNRAGREEPQTDLPFRDSGEAGRN